MNERYIKWYTPWLNREFEMLVFGSGGGLPLILFPTSFGHYYQNKGFWPDWFGEWLCRCG
jgi:esterase/lipase superfamily enzyme